MSISIGPLTIDDPVFLAPMSGVTDLPFRRLVKRHGAGLVFSEMIASRVMVDDYHRTSRVDHTDYAEEFPMAVQLAGCEPAIMAEAARINEGNGAAIIDINFGCPVKKVVNNFAGSALMRDETLAVQIMEATVKAVNVPVTVKMRLGWDDDTINAPRLARMAQDVGVQMITVHGRTRMQLYTGQANWDAVRAVKNAVDIPVIVNGDITGPATARDALDQSGADGVMIGRGAYGRPWIIRHTMDYLREGRLSGDPAPADKRALILSHYESMLSYYGVQKGMGIARKHISWYCGDYPGGDDLRSAIIRMDNPAAVMNALDHFLMAQESAHAGALH